jgi:predicted metallo-beta-lactamase superfamily hydrolase
VAADGKAFNYGKTALSFSGAVAHGSEDPMLGWVIMAIVEHENERFMFAPDIQGPMAMSTLDLIRKAEPSAIMVGGPPLYLGGSRVATSQIERGLRNMESIVQAVPTVILEHHVLRDEAWKQKMAKVYEKASETGHSIMTAAEYSGKENIFLESKRKQFFEDFPPAEEFKQWMRTLKNRKIGAPPI